MNREGNYTHYNTDLYELETVLKRTQKYGKMIDPKELVEGTEYLKDIMCAACKKISLKLDVKECMSCKSIICDMCYMGIKMKLEDDFLQEEVQADSSF